MELTKNQWVLKALVEEMLRRTHKIGAERNPPEDVVTGMQILRALLPEQIYVISTAPRIVIDFARAMKRPMHHVRHLAHEDDAIAQLSGKDNLHIVQLHTGLMTPIQCEIRRKIMQVLVTRCRNHVVWHVGEWNV